MRSPDTNVITLARPAIAAPPKPFHPIIERDHFERWAMSSREEPAPANAESTRRGRTRPATDDRRLRIRHHNQLRLITHPAFERAHRETATHIATADGAGLDRPGIALIGPSMSGKTTLLYSLMADHYRDSQPPASMDPDADHVPVLYVIAGAEATPKPLLQALLRFYSPLYVTDDTVNVLQDRLHTIINACGTSLVVIDEIHRIKPIDSQGRPTGDILRGIQNNTPATILLAGVTDHIPGLFDPHKNWGQVEADQLRKRFTTASLAAYTRNDEDDILRILHQIWCELDLRKEPDSIDGSALADHLSAIIEASGGCVGSLINRIVSAANTAIVTGQERLTKKNLGI